MNWVKIVEYIDSARSKFTEIGYCEEPMTKEVLVFTVHKEMLLGRFIFREDEVFGDSLVFRIKSADEFEMEIQLITHVAEMFPPDLCALR